MVSIQPTHHAFITIVFAISRDIISRRRKERLKLAWPSCFVSRTHDHQLCAEASMTIAFARLSTR
ncbi:hypothetical protein NC653_031927 [Populus alba x Populus x berolinensis]|uniref:Uncharacterized protein n=1 Tax=Populus alba x Populus x berolinensis TaxID=444605 RepID=A0AAD6LZM5_9ROSI|nr:hypothetical protein NC653_031927 [Populus alba x Populus x berolinensis]